MPQYEIKINGRVQGVGFRYYAKKQADFLRLNGWIKNLSDGSVMVIVQGEETDINTFIDYLRIGTSRSQVTNLQKVKIQGGVAFAEFSIRY